MLPNFIIFGAIKGGTTSLSHYLKAHQDIYMSPLKETRFFCYDRNDPLLRSKPDSTFPIRTFDEYVRLFDGAIHEKAIGEASPQYLRSPIAARNIRKHIPNVRLICSLRNPVERAYSAYLMDVRSGKERRSIDEAFGDSSFLATSLYYQDLKRYFDSFDRTQIKIVLLDDIRRDSLSVVQQLFGFLGVDETFTPDTSENHNPGGLPKSQTLYRLLRFKDKRVKRVLLPIIPKRLRELRKSFIRNKLLTSGPALSPKLRTTLAGYYRRDILQVQDLIERDLSHWLEMREPHPPNSRVSTTAFSAHQDH